MSKDLKFRATPGGVPFTATLQENGNYLVSREGRIVREYTLSEIVNSFKYKGWETA